MKTEKLQNIRLLDLDWLVREGCYPNGSIFAARYRISDKTAQRDIEFLRDVFGAPLVYCPEKHGYVYDHKDWNFPQLFVFLALRDLAMIQDENLFDDWLPADGIWMEDPDRLYNFYSASAILSINPMSWKGL